MTIEVGKKEKGQFKDKGYEGRLFDMMEKVMSGLSTAITTRKNLKLPRYPKIPQDIPDYFKGADLKQPDAILGALWLSKENNLLPPNTPLRQVWYTFIKLTLQKLKKQAMHPVSAFSTNFKDLVENSDLMYADFNIVNPPDKFNIKAERHYFPNVLIGLEKESYYGFFQKFANLIGVHLFAAGGQPAYSGTEEIARQIAEKTGYDEPTGKLDEWGDEITRKKLDELNVMAVSDYDPSGLNIGNAIAKQFSSHMGRRYGTNVSSYRAAPTLTDYTPAELTKASYNVKGSTVDQKLWKADSKNRLAKNFIDDRFKDVTIYDDTPKSWMMRFLAGGDQKMKAPKAKKWIAKWKARIEADPEDYPHMFGLEVESLPREPLPRQLPAGFTWNGVGQARAKLLTFEELERVFPDGVEDGFKEWLRKNFRDADNRYRAANAVERKSGLDKFDSQKGNIDTLYKALRLIKRYALEDDIDELTEVIQDWQVDEYDKIIDDNSNFDKYHERLVKAIANDEQDFEFNSSVGSRIIPSIPNSVLEHDISEEVKEMIEGNTEIVKDRVKELCKIIIPELPENWEELITPSLEYSWEKDDFIRKLKRVCPSIEDVEDDSDDEYDSDEDFDDEDEDEDDD